MLPQMMPLPWLLLYFMIFSSFFSLFLLVTFFLLDISFSSKIMKSSLLYLFW